MRRSGGDLLFDALNRGFLIILAITISYPFWTTVMMSFSRHGNVGVAYGNSVFRVVVGTTLTVVFTLMAVCPSPRGASPAGLCSPSCCWSPCSSLAG